MTAARTPTEFVLLTGFLGSGKTTLLRDFLAGPEAADTAVIINEAGEINIDGAIIAESAHGLPIALLSSGCVCCSVSNDLLYTIEALVEGRRDAGEPPFRRIVLECSGLSLPSAVLRSFGPNGPAGMPTRIVATIDARGSALDAGFEDAVAQLAAAHTIVVTKLDQPLAEGTNPIRNRIAALNPLARLVEMEDPRERARATFLLGDPAVEAPAVASSCSGWSRPHARVVVSRATFASPMSWADLQEWLENLAGFCGSRLLRMKGIVSVSDCAEPILVQAVGNLFGVPRRMLLTTDPVEGLVIITRDLSLSALRESIPGRDATFSGGHIESHQVKTSTAPFGDACGASERRPNISVSLEEAKDPGWLAARWSLIHGFAMLAIDQWLDSMIQQSPDPGSLLDSVLESVWTMWHPDTG